MKKFVYSCINGNTTIDADGTLQEMAGEVGHVAHTLYSAYAHKDPALAEAFKMMVIATITHPKSPAWNVRENIPGDLEILCNVPPTDGGK